MPEAALKKEPPKPSLAWAEERDPIDVVYLRQRLGEVNRQVDLYFGEATRQVEQGRLMQEAVRVLYAQFAQLCSEHDYPSGRPHLPGRVRP